MLEVSFYILSPGAYSESLPGQFGNASQQQSLNLIACKLAEKAFHKGIYCVIYTHSEAHSRIIDDLLWTFRNTSFIPHQILMTEQPISIPQVLICNGFLPQAENLTVINLTNTCPNNLERCTRILEIVDNNETTKQAGRQRYRHYQNLGANLVTHKL